MATNKTAQLVRDGAGNSLGTKHRLKLSARGFVLVWLVIAAARVAIAALLLFLEVRGKTGIQHLPLVFALWPEIAILPLGSLGLHPFEYGMVLSLALCVGSGALAAVITLLFYGISRGH